jgi:formylglycine-generating enzyme required for sulfatase activity
VTLSKPFSTGGYEVTTAQWKRVMGSDPSKWKDDDGPYDFLGFRLAPSPPGGQPVPQEAAE